MKVIAYVFFLLSLSLPTLYAQANINVIIPKPQKFQSLKGSFTLSDQTHYHTKTPLASNAIKYLQQQLFLSSDFRLERAQSPVQNRVNFHHTYKLKEEAYILHITSKEIIIKANSTSGFFYGAVSLMQLMDARIWGQTESKHPGS